MRLKATSRKAKKTAGVLRTTRAYASKPCCDESPYRHDRAKVTYEGSEVAEQIGMRRQKIAGE